MSNIFGSDDSTALPGGKLAKPLIIALLALLASRYMGGKGASDATPAPTPRTPDPLPTSDPTPGSILDGLGGLIKQFQQKGLGDAVDTWVKTGTNQGVTPVEVKEVLPPDIVDQLARRTGLTRDQVLDELAKILPNAVDRLTPGGRLPTQAELQRLMG
jgi:uncharacterized protein YidB (DUF937 family)